MALPTYGELTTAAPPSYDELVGGAPAALPVYDEIAELPPDVPLNAQQSLGAQVAGIGAQVALMPAEADRRATAFTLPREEVFRQIGQQRDTLESVRTQERATSFSDQEARKIDLIYSQRKEESKLREMEEEAEQMTRQPKVGPEYGQQAVVRNLRNSSQVPGPVETFFTQTLANLESMTAGGLEALNLPGALTLREESKKAHFAAGLNESTMSDIARGGGDVASFLLGPKSLPSMAAKGGFQAYNDALAGGASPAEAKDVALKTAPVLALYLAGGYGAAKLAGGLVPASFTPATKGLAQFGAAAAANVEIGAAIRAANDEPTTMRNLAADTLFAMHAGKKGYEAASAEARAKAGEILQQERGFSEEQLQEALTAPDTGEPVPAVRVVPPSAAEIVPAIRVGEEVVKGNPGEAHIGIIKRYIAENPEQAGAIGDFDTTANPNFFVGPDGVPISREQLKAQFGVRDAQGLDELQRNLGPGAANIEEPFGPQFQTSNKETTVNAERKARDLDPVIKEARISNAESIDHARDVLETNPNKGDQIVERLRTNPQERTISLEDSAVMLVEKTNLVAQRDAAAARMLDPNRTPEDVAENAAEFQFFEQKILALDQAAQDARSTWGRFGQLYQRTMRNDYSLVNMEAQARIKKQAPLTPEESATIKAQSERIAELERQIAENEKVKTEADAEKAVDETIKATKKTPPKGVAGTVGEQAALAAKMAARLKAGDKLPELRSYIDRLVESLIRGGINERGALVDAVHKIIEPMSPGITPRQTRDLISDYGNFRPLNKEPVKVRKRELKGELQLVSKIDDVMARIPPAKSGPERAKLSDEARRLTTQLNEAKKLFPVVVTDPAAQLKSATDAIVTRLRNQIKDITHRIDTGEKPAGKTPVPETPEIVRLRTLRDRVQTTLDEVEGPRQISDAQRAKVATASLERQIGELDRQIKSGRADERGKGPRFTTPEIEALRAQRDAMRAEVDELRATDALLAEEAKFDAAMKAADALEARLATGDLSPQSNRVNGPDIELVAQAKERLAGLRKELKDRRDALKPKLTREQVAIKAMKTRLTRENAELLDRIARQDFAPKVKRPPLDFSKDAEAVRLKAASDTIKGEFQKQQQKWRAAEEWRNKTFSQKVGHGIKLGWQALRNLKLSMDMSSTIQTAMAMAARPIEGLKATGKGLRTFGESLFSKQNAYAKRLEARLEMNSNNKSGLYKEMGLDIRTGEVRDENAASILERMADFETRWAGVPDVVKGLMNMSGKQIFSGAKQMALIAPKLVGKGIRASNEAFQAVANTMRSVTADAILKKEFGTTPPTKAQAQLLGNHINAATGAGGLKNTEGLRAVLFAPNWYLSLIKSLSGQPFWKAIYQHQGKAARIIATDYVRSLASLGVLLGARELFSDDKRNKLSKDELLSPTAGTIRMPSGTRIDLTQGRAAWLSLAARMLYGGKKEENGAFKKQAADQALLQFFKGRLSQEIRTGLSVATQKDYRGKPLELGKFAEEMVTPLTWKDVDRIIKAEGMTRGSFLQLMNFIFANVKPPQREY